MPIQKFNLEKLKDLLVLVIALPEFPKKKEWVHYGEEILLMS